MFIQNAEIMIGELQIIFGGHPVALGLRIARQVLVLFEKLARIAPLARINPVSRVRPLALTAAATHRTLPAPTAPIIAAVLPIIDQNSISLFVDPANACCSRIRRSEEHTSELQSLMRSSYAAFCLHQKHTH